MVPVKRVAWLAVVAQHPPWHRSRRRRRRWAAPVSVPRAASVVAASDASRS